MDRLARLMSYARQNFGDTPGTTERVLRAVRDGTEAALLTPAQRRRDAHKSRVTAGSHRQSQRAARQARSARRAALWES